MKPTPRRPLQIGPFVIATSVLLLTVALWLLIAGQRGEAGAGSVTATGSSPEPIASPTPSLGAYPGPAESPTVTIEPPVPTVYPTATLLPDVNIHIGQVDNLSSRFAALAFPAADSESFSRPAIDGQTLVGEVPPIDRKHPGSIMMVDLISGATQTLAEVSDVTAPQISDQYIVWDDAHKLMVYDRKSQTIEPVPVGDKATHASLSGTVVVWENITKDQYLGLWAYDIVAKKDFQVIGTADGTKPYKPLISGRWVVYEYAQDVNGVGTENLNAVNLDSHEVIEIGKLAYSDGFVPQLYAIDAPWVAWSAYSYDPNLYLFNLETREARTITVPSCTLAGNKGNLSNVTISGSTVLFSGCFQDMGYDIDSNTFFSVPVRTPGAIPIGWAIANDEIAVIQSVPSNGQYLTQLLTAAIYTK